MTNDITCVMITQAGREQYARMSIESFLRQSYENAELLIINQGHMSLFDRHPRIREVFTQPFEFTGDARNYALNLIGTEYYIHWDDDDHHGPGRIELQLGQHKQTKLPNMLKHFMLGDIHTGEGCITTAEKGYIGTICCKTDIAKNYGYGSCAPHEEKQLIDGLRDYYDAFDIIDNATDIYLRWYHGTNTCTREHMYENAGRVKRELKMKERWYFNAVYAAWTLLQLPSEVDDLGFMANKLKGVPFMTYKQAHWLQGVFHDRPSRRALEIGTCHGVGTAFLSLLFSWVDTLDVPSSLRRTPNVWDTLWATQRHNVSVKYRLGGDREIPGNHMYDLIYVDGGHGKSQVEADLQAARARLNPGGLIIMDDLNHPVYTGIREVYEAQPDSAKYEHEGWGVIVQ